MVAPIRDLPIDGKGHKQWRRISGWATDLAEPKTIYLPGSSKLGLQRSRADLCNAFVVPRLLLLELARQGKRIAALGASGVAHLQFRLGILLSREARDDYSWPSKDDLQIKVVHLQFEMTEKRTELAALRAACRPEDEEDIELIEHELSVLEKEERLTNAAINTADDLEIIGRRS